MNHVTDARAALVMQEPRVQMSRSGRKIQADWLLRTDEDGKRHYLTLTASYNSGGMNYFSGTNEPRCYQAGFGIETEEDSSIGTGVMRGFALFSAVGFLRSDPVGRFSAKRLDDFFWQQALPALRGLVVASDERVMRYFED